MSKYPLPEQLTIKITKPTDQLTTWERLLLADLLETIKRVKRNTHTSRKDAS